MRARSRGSVPTKTRFRNACGWHVLRRWNMPSAAEKLEALLREVRACQVCADHLPFPPRPILRAGVTAKILIVGQAPGRRVHETGIPWNDPSGDRLREWMQVSRDIFYDEKRIALI